MEEPNDNLSIPIEDLEVDLGILGTGGFGRVYKGTWNGAGGGIEVAIKEVTPAKPTKDKLRKLIEEVRIMAPLHHKCICPVCGYTIIDNCGVWLVLSFIQGGDLSNFLARNYPLPLETQIRFALDAAMAVNYLHTRTPPILHRDIKAQNFLVQEIYGELHLLLADFGLAKISDAVGFTLSTPNWSPPEVLGAKPEWTEKADIYSLGMLFYEIVTNSCPFDGIENVWALAEVLNAGQRPEIPETCAESVAKIIRKCWEFDSKLRPNACDLVGELRKLLREVITKEKQQIKQEMQARDKEEISRLRQQLAKQQQNEELLRKELKEEKAETAQLQQQLKGKEHLEMKLRQQLEEKQQEVQKLQKELNNALESLPKSCTTFENDYDTEFLRTMFQKIQDASSMMVISLGFSLFSSNHNITNKLKSKLKDGNFKLTVLLADPNNAALKQFQKEEDCRLTAIAEWPTTLYRFAADAFGQFPNATIARLNYFPMHTLVQIDDTYLLRPYGPPTNGGCLNPWIMVDQREHNFHSYCGTCVAFAAANYTNSSTLPSN